MSYIDPDPLDDSDLVRLLVECSEMTRELNRVKGRSPEEMVELIAFLLTRFRPGRRMRNPGSGHK
jgi:hypothetical protein